jgi:hypothetical protein
MAETVARLKKMQFEPPSAANNFVSRGLAARAALGNLAPRQATLLRLQKDSDYRMRMAVSRRNRRYETQRAVSTGALSGQRVSFRSVADAGRRYTGRVQDVLSGNKTYGENKRSRGMARTKIGEQFSLIGRPTPIRSNRRTTSNFNPDTYRLKKPRRGRIRNR